MVESWIYAEGGDKEFVDRSAMECRKKRRVRMPSKDGVAII